MQQAGAARAEVWFAHAITISAHQANRSLERAVQARGLGRVHLVKCQAISRTTDRSMKSLKTLAEYAGVMASFIPEDPHAWYSWAFGDLAHTAPY